MLLIEGDAHISEKVSLHLLKDDWKSLEKHMLINGVYMYVQLWTNS